MVSDGQKNGLPRYAMKKNLQYHHINTAQHNRHHTHAKQTLYKR